MKKVLSCIAFCLILFGLLHQAGEILISKPYNRYYHLEKHLEEIGSDFDVQIYGSCHSYTSFNPNTLREQTGLESFVFGNPGEIIPTTYLRMREQFKDYAPKVALVETWGINPYETYDSTESILGSYLQTNMERIPFSFEKLKVIQRYSSLDFVESNFLFSKYKERIMENALHSYDFDYSFEEANNDASEVSKTEMISRLENNGFKVNPSTPLNDYLQLQKHVRKSNVLEIEPDIAEYIIKIIELCDSYDVELIFYRSPYISKVNELRKLNHFQQICDAYNVQFLNLEKEIRYDYSTDFFDYEHLSETGATKSTEYLIPYITEAITSHDLQNNAN